MSRQATVQIEGVTRREAQLILFAVRHFASRTRREAERCARVGKTNIALREMDTHRELRDLLAKLEAEAIGS